MDKISIPTFVKWAGGKIQLLEQIEKLLPKKIDRYFEPFVGSGAVFFYIKQTRHPDYCMISDNNQDLINLYKDVKNNLDELINLLQKYKKEHTKFPMNYYYKQRKRYNKTHNTLEKSGLFIYLNKTCYNGLYRVNSKGDFNVPFGRYKNPSILQKDKLENASKILNDKKVKIMSMDFTKILLNAKKGDFIYFDPPYYPLSTTSSFTSYHKEGFLKEEQKKLANVFEKLDKRGCLLMLSNSDTPLIHELYNKYEKEGHLYLVKAKRMINCNSDGRKSINEVVVINYKPRSIQKILPSHV
jgi:DNA adenine methylase